MQTTTTAAVAGVVRTTADVGRDSPADVDGWGGTFAQLAPGVG